MADKPYKDDDKNKEYRPFDENQDVQYDFTEEAGKKKMLSKFRSKPVLAVVAIIILVGVVYKVVQVVKADHQKPSLPAVSEQSKLASINAQAKQANLEAIKKQEAAEKVLNQKLAAQKAQQVEESQKSIVQLRQMQTQTQQHLASVDQSLQQVSNQLSVVATQVGKLSAQMQALQAEKSHEAQLKAEMKKKQDAVTRAKLNYFVQAVIPGRAWLKSPNGQSLTVTVGDTIPAYGQVLSIDSYSGSVVTSSGHVIQYAMQEQ
ncbi:MAG: hypothetical protein CMF39_05135 [Legionellaceae bacterium]|nr:hypothetical protein [Legionellaceae bacterium]